MAFFFKKSAKTVKNLEYHNYLQLLESGYINLRPRDESIIRNVCAKKRARNIIVKEQKAREKISYVLFLNSDCPID